MQIAVRADLYQESSAQRLTRIIVCLTRRQVDASCIFKTWFLQLVAQDAMRLLREAGAGASGIDEPIVLVVSEQQRANAVDAVGGQGEAADHELLFVVA